MKKLSLISVAALMLASCSNEDVVPAGEGQEQQVTISLELPAEINSRAMAGTSSANGGLTNVTDEGLTFNVALYSESNTTPVFVGTKTVGTGESVASFTPTVVLGKKYTVVAYASYDESIEWTKETGASTVTPTQVINDEAEDAYFTNQEITASANMKATLTRPYGKIRIIANDYAEALETQFNSTIASVTVTYKDGQATTFSPKAGNFGADKGNAVFTDEAFATNYTDETGDAKTIFVDYVPATATGEIVNIQSVTVTFVGGETYTKDLSTLDIPVKRNHLTTLSGDFFTSDAVLDLEVKDQFASESEVNYELAAAFANGGVVTLDEAVTLNRTLVAKAGANVVLNMTENAVITNKSTNSETDVIVVEPGATLTINGNGRIEAVSGNNGFTIIADGKVVINGGTFRSGHEQSGDGNCTVYARGNGEVYIYGGDFSTPEGDNTTYVLNKQGDSVNTAKILVYGGSFKNFNPQSNPADGAGTNYVAEGYKSTAIGDVYYVTKASETPIAAGVVQVADNEYAVSSAEGMSWFADQVNTNGKAGMTITLTNDIDLNNVEWTPIGQTGGYNVATFFQGVFDGNGHTIKNLKITTTNEGGNYAAGLFGFIDAASATIKNLTIEGAVVNGHHWTGVIAGYLSGTIENCHVKKATVVCTHANKDACGDKAGTITGYINSGIVKGCTAEYSTVAASRDGGQIVGAARTYQVSDCSVTEVTVSATNDECNHSNAGVTTRNELIGSVLD